MDQYQEDSGSDGDSITMEIERSDAVIVYGCNNEQYSHPVNHVTKVLIGPRDPNPSAGEITILTNESAPESVCSGNANHKLSSQFVPSDDHGMALQTQVKPYEELAEAWPHLTVAAQGKEVIYQGSYPVSPALSRRFHNSLRSEVSPPNKNPFLSNANTSHTNSGEFLIGSSPGNLLDLTKSAAVSSGILPHAINLDTIPTPSAESGTVIDPPGAFHSPDLLGNGTSSAIISELSQGSCQSAVATAGSAQIENPVCSPLNPENASTPSTNVPQAMPPDVTIQSQNMSSRLVEPLLSTANQAAPSLPDPPTEVEIANAAYSQELTPIQESVNTIDKSESSFCFPEPPRPAPLVCVPVKEVKFEEPPKHPIVTALENAVEKLGEIVQITVQPCHTTQNVAKVTDEPNVIALPTYSPSQFQSTASVGSSSPPTTSTQASNIQTELKMNSINIQEPQIPPDQVGPEENEHSYGIIGNEDNLSEITLQTLAEGSANHRDHAGDAYSNRHPHHRIRISIDQQSATPSRRAMVITALLVVLLISTVILIVVYKFVNKSSAD